jgi:hypothetical protein
MRARGYSGGNAAKKELTERGSPVRSDDDQLVAIRFAQSPALPSQTTQL